MQKSKLIFLLALALSVVPSAFAQDVIVTTNGDSLNCKLLSFDDNYYYISVIQDSIKVKSKLPTSQILDYKYHFYKRHQTDSVFNKRGFFRFRNALSIGLNISKENGYIALSGNHLGFNLDYNFTWFFIKNLGIGVKENFTLYGYGAIGGSGGGNIYMGATIISGLIGYSNFASLFVAPRIYLNKRNSNFLYANVGCGYLYSPDNSYSAFSGYFGLGYDIRTNRLVGFGIELSLITGKSTWYHYLNKEYNQNLNQILLTLGIRINN